MPWAASGSWVGRSVWIQGLHSSHHGELPPATCRVIEINDDGTVAIHLEGHRLELWTHDPARLEAITDEHGPGMPGRPTVRVTPPRHTGRERNWRCSLMVKVLGVEVEIGEPWRLGPLSVFPLRSTAAGRAAYVSGPDAFKGGLVAVRELDPPQVPFLIVENLAPVPLLLLEGETLVGGNQNRTLNSTVLIPAGARTEVPVSCVEAGRWGKHENVVRSHAHLPGTIRAAKTATLSKEQGPNRWRSDQGRVWIEVDKQSRRHCVQSETAALEDVQEALSGDLESVLAELMAEPSQVGIACLSGKRVLGVDLFAHPETLASYLNGLVAGYWLDAEDGDGTALVSEIEQFLSRVNKAKAAVGPGVGIGEEVRLEGAVTGVGLRVDGELVHLGAFPEPDQVA